MEHRSVRNQGPAPLCSFSTRCYAVAGDRGHHVQDTKTYNRHRTPLGCRRGSINTGTTIITVTWPGSYTNLTNPSLACPLQGCTHGPASRPHMTVHTPLFRRSSSTRHQRASSMRSGPDPSTLTDPSALPRPRRASSKRGPCWQGGAFENGWAAADLLGGLSTTPSRSNADPMAVPRGAHGPSGVARAGQHLRAHAHPRVRVQLSSLDGPARARETCSAAPWSAHPASRVFLRLRAGLWSAYMRPARTRRALCSSAPRTAHLAVPHC